MIECSPSQPNAARLLLKRRVPLAERTLPPPPPPLRLAATPSTLAGSVWSASALMQREWKHHSSNVWQVALSLLLNQQAHCRPRWTRWKSRCALPLCSADRQRSVWPPAGVGYYSADFHFQKNPDRAHGTPLLLLSPEWQSIESTWK